MQLHEELGPARTTIKAIAERAGVERLTVYRHFPDQDVLFRACSSRFLEVVPPPHPSQWNDLEDPSERMEKALETFYSYYGRTESMWTSVYRDLEDIEALATVTAEFHAFLDQIRDELLSHWKVPQGARTSLRGIIGHAIGFSTWKSLRSQGLSDRKAVSLIVEWARAVAA